MDYSIFAMQVVRRMKEPRDLVYEQIYKAIMSEPERTTPGQRYRFYRKVCGDLLQSVKEFERGVWDYWDVPSRAPGDFQDWVDGLQGRESRSSPAPEDGQPRYMVFTMSLLLVHGSTSDERMTAHCNIPESRLWRKDTFEHLLKGIPLLNFLNVQSDVVYLLPGNDQACGLTEENLGSEDYHYLRDLV